MTPPVALEERAHLPDATVRAIDQLLAGRAGSQGVIQQEVVEEQRPCGVHGFVQEPLAFRPAVCLARDAQPDEYRLNGRADREDGIVLPDFEQDLDRRGIETTEALEELSNLAEVLLAEELEADVLPLAVEELEGVLEKDSQLEGSGAELQGLLDLSDGADAHLVPVHEDVFEGKVALERHLRGQAAVQLVEDDQVGDVPGIVDSFPNL